MNWYTKRASLAAIYSSADIFMTQDLSPQYTETEKFLNRRLEQAAWIGSSTRQVRTFYIHIYKIMQCNSYINNLLVGYHVDIWGQEYDQCTC